MHLLCRKILTALLRIELVDNATEISEELAINTSSHSRSSSWSSEANVDVNKPTLRDSGAPHRPMNEHGKDEVDSVAKLKERLQLAEKANTRLGQLYQNYRLRWLEECYQTRVLEEYAPKGVSTCSPHQITWDAPSPTQSTLNMHPLKVN